MNVDGDAANPLHRVFSSALASCPGRACALLGTRARAGIHAASRHVDRLQHKRPALVNDNPAQRLRYKRALFWLGERIAGIGLWAGAVALLVIVVLNAINIIMRYFLRNP